MNSTIWLQNDIKYVIVSTKLYLNVGNDEHITLCNFGGRFLTGLVIEGRASEGAPGCRKQKSKI